MDGAQMAARLSNGRFLQRLADAVEKVSDAVVAVGEKGSITITLTIDKPQADMPMVTISERIAAKAPVKKGEGGVFFVHEGQLHARDPRQPEMPLQVIAGGNAQVRRADDDGQEVRQVSDA